MYNQKNTKGQRRIKKTKSNDKFTLLWCITAILVSILIGFAISFAMNPQKVSSLVEENLNNISNGIKTTPLIPPILGGKQNILLLGVDSNGKQADPFKGTRSDSMILITLNPLAKTANAISIPRDSKVFIADNYGLDKINAAHAFGGPDLTIKTIEKTFGVKIDHYVAIDYEGINELVDALGGVTVNVEKRMRYVDHSGGLNINLYPGTQLLSAKQAEGYLRFRHDAIGDIGRMKRQQWFVKGLVKKLQSPEIIVKLPQVLQLASKYIRTDMNFYQLSQLAAYSKVINLDDVQTSTLPGKPSRLGHISYWILEPNKTQEIIDRLVYDTDSVTKEEPLSIGLMYSRAMESKVPEVKAMIESMGYKISCNAATKEAHTQILAHSSYASFKHAKEMKDKIPELQNAQFVISPNQMMCADTDYTVILSGK